MNAAALAPSAVGDLWERIIAFAEHLEPAQLPLPTPCPAWNIRDLLAHCAGIQTLFDGGPQPDLPDGWTPPEGAAPSEAWTAAGVAARHAWTYEQVLEELRAARDGHVSRLNAVTDWTAGTTGPNGQTTEAGLVTVRCFDLWVHLQDLRVAVGEDPDFNDESPAAETAHRFVLDLVPWMFAKKVQAPDGSALRLRLGAPLEVDTVLTRRDGRAAFDADAPTPADSVTSSPAAFTLLASGRRDGEHWRRHGELDWSGELGQAFVERARVF